MTKFAAASGCGIAVLLTVVACSRRTIEWVPPSASPASEPGFSTASDASAEAEPGLIAYCATLECTNNTATCEGSRFPCDVDLMNDDSNCGACGFACPGSSEVGIFHCASGRCILSCPEGHLDCNGDVEDGCEVTLGTNDNCTSCGDACPGPAAPCVQAPGGIVQCGCPHGLTLCGNNCVDTRIEDGACGGCSTQCDKTGDGGAQYPHVHYGCLNSKCGHAKCDQGYEDCDGDPSNGCETQTNTPQNCGGCGVRCKPGQRCADDGATRDHDLTCVCEGNKTWCGDRCVDLSQDPSNCGACGVECELMQGATGEGIGHRATYCAYGSCAYECVLGWGDCNGDTSDGCETNMQSDPNNCGACGAACEGDQPCIGGRCAVKPCPSQGEEAR